MISKKKRNFIGIDLGIAKSGLCWIVDNRVDTLTIVKSKHLVDKLSSLEDRYSTPTTIVVDAPIDPTFKPGFRIVDRIFMSGLFNNNHVGLQPNNPDLLNLTQVLEPLCSWAKKRGVLYTNDVERIQTPCLLETMPNVALGITIAPDLLLTKKWQLRFRYGRGKNIAPIIVAFECLENERLEFFAPIESVPQSWADLERKAKEIKDITSVPQSDDLISALTCACLGWWACQKGEYGFVREGRGHYLLPKKDFVHERWRKELGEILKKPKFLSAETNIADKE